MAVLLVLSLVCYLVGAVPFGYLVAKRKGVDLFRVGSGNVGATNVGRVLGRKFGILVFVLDFLKGALPVAAIVPLSKRCFGGAVGEPDELRVMAAACAFLGHLFPVYLRFRGGKGVATGAGAVAVLATVPFLAALATWLFALLLSRMVSLASILAVVVLTLVQMLIGHEPFGIVTGFCLVGSLFVIVRHRANIGRLIRGTESQIGDGVMRQNLLQVVHIVAIGLWVGGAGFFNFITAPSLFATFAELVKMGPSDRTANVTIVPVDSSDETQKNLGSALAGAAVGPIFPKYFAWQIVCSIAVLATAWSWRNSEPSTNRHRIRLRLAFLALLSVGVGCWVSIVVSRLRLARFDTNPEFALLAREQFATWHFVSLGLSFVTISLAFAILVLAASLPREEAPSHSTTGLP